ncbi:MAG: helix-turn-helix transcriptional regulator [Candidatus Nanopelagicales bacterium]
MSTSLPSYNERLRAVRERVGVSQEAAADAIGVSQPTYSRIEDGTRPLKGDELVILADLFDVRAAAITGIAVVSDRARFAARTDGSNSPMVTMRDRLYAYLELDAYLAEHGFPAA